MEEDIKKIMDLIGNGNGWALDVGTGAGKMAEALTSYGYRVVSIEYNKEILEKTKRRFEEMGIDNVLFINGDAHEMPFLDDTFDLVVTYNAMHHMADYKKVLDEMWRVCKKDGRRFVIELNSQGRERVKKAHEGRGHKHEVTIDINDIRDYIVDNYGREGFITKGEYIDIFSY